MIVRGQAAIGISLALAVFAAWLTLHIYGVFFHPLGGTGLLVAPLLLALLCWLNVGLFIVAHDAMHGSLAPKRPGVNRWFGRAALAFYAGFSFDGLLPKHFEHHRSPGSADDPDFSTAHPRHFWPWYLQFMRIYFGWQQMAVLTVMTVAYLLIGARYANLLLFWALPAILSSVQLFYFGTYRPHRHDHSPFADDHNARSNAFGWLASLLSCYHFGYHHEHHLAPYVPWWRLPAERKARATAR
ncbi:MAG: fatty acid desaturase [Pseudomonadota bacterium]|nr:fatty acid desaturase [Pseudomonadota bacterium]